MKSCQIWGDLGADRVDEQYPTVTVCDACVAENRGGEDAAIVGVVGSYDPAYGDECHFCGVSKVDEADSKKT